MGFSMSRFRMMKGLCSGNPRVVDKLSEFKIVCIVLHDPDDGRFIIRMKERFVELRERTGRDMLFITFVRPSETLGNMRQTMTFDMMEEQNLYIEKGVDDNVVIGNFLRSVMPEGDLPSILVTDNLMSGDFVYLPTSAQSFGSQLISIGKFCTSREGRFPVSDPAFLEMLEGIGKPQLRSSGRPLARSIADCLALSEAGRDKVDPFARRDAERWAEERLSELRKEAENAAPDEKSRLAAMTGSYENALKKAKDRTSAPNACCYILSESQSVKSCRNNEESIYSYSTSVWRNIETREPTFGQKYGFRTGDIKGFDLCNRISKDDICLYNDELSRFSSNPRPSRRELEFTESGIQRDFTGLVHYLANFMETEINLSLVQQMRQGCGIEMPQWYGRFKPNFTARIPAGELTGRVQYISVNSDKNHDCNLQPVMLSKAYYAYRDMTRPGADPGIPREMSDAFMERWRTIYTIRNAGEHTALPTMYGDPDGDYKRLDFNMFSEIHSAFSAILAEDLKTLLDVKVRLRGR